MLTNMKPGDTAIIPTSNNKARLKQNLEVKNMCLEALKLQESSGLDKGLLFNDPGFNLQSRIASLIDRSNLLKSLLATQVHSNTKQMLGSVRYFLFHFISLYLCKSEIRALNDPAAYASP